MKTVAAQYHDALAQLARCKPRSERYFTLRDRVKSLLRRQIAIEDKEDRKRGRGR